MTWKDELLMLWIFCSVLIVFAVRHFLGGAAYVVEHAAAFCAACLPGVQHLMIGHFR